MERKEKPIMGIAESFGFDQVITNEPPNRPISIGAPLSLTVYVTGARMTGLIVREGGRINQKKSWLEERK